MFSNKYLKDYRVEEYIDEKGRTRKEAIYIGGDYSVSPPVSFRGKVLMVCLAALSLFAFLGALVPMINAARRSYIMLPFVVSALPMYFVIASTVSFLFSKEVMIRENAEKITRRLPPCAFFTLVLSGAAFLGTIISAAISWDSFIPGDFIFAALCLAVFAASSVIFIKCRKIKAVKRDSGG